MKPSKCRFPYQNSYHSIETTASISFQYIERPFEDRLIFVGDEGSRKVLIKFTRTYCSTAHQELANMKFAPALYGFEQLPGGWYMVAMEYLDEDHGWVMLYDIPTRDRASFQPDIHAAVEHLHDKGYMHGDIRVGNILVHCKSRAVKFLDFDQAGVEGESKYPANWNTTGVVRPDGAYDGQLITKAHDLFMVGELFKREYSGRTLYSTQLPPKSTTEDASRNDKILPYFI